MTKPAIFAIVLIDKITDPEKPMRDDLTPESVEELSRSIRSLGLIEPLVLKVSGDYYEVIAGHRRLLAAALADLVEVPAYVVDVDDEKADLMKIHENLHRQDVTPIEEGKYFTYLKQKYGWNHVVIAGHIGKSKTYVGERMEIERYPEDIKEALTEGAINIAVARELAEVDDDSQRRQYLDYAIQNGITWSVANAWKQQYKAQKGAPVQNGTGAPTLPTVIQPIRTMIKCPICADELPMADAKLAYLHKECFNEVVK